SHAIVIVIENDNDEARARRSRSAQQVIEGVPMTTVSTTTAITANNLEKRFGKVAALRGLDLEVAHGSVFGFLGPNGAGKTTALSILAGLAQPTSGSARIYDRDVVQDGLAVRRSIGFLRQD